ncbi:MAG: amidohydrolase [Synergistaceae bacterium]|jgi:amidohydrolase|nr:amidohydrolase [Synergistaceae bacterium]
MENMIEKIKGMAKELDSEVVERRRRFHMNPEVSWEEVQTTRAIAEELHALGCENVRVGFGGTESGVVADIKCGRQGRCVALRADIDALPLDEENDVPYKSRRPGTMHACGHDAHTAILLSAAKVISKLKGEMSGTVRLLFQPAEESGAKSGASALIEGGALDGADGRPPVDAVFGLHVMADVPTGTLVYRKGPFMAASDRWELVIEGKGGHASTPDKTFDPITAAAEVVGALQTIVAREVSPRDAAVLSIGGMRSSSYVFNIIPERVEMNGAVRTFRREVQDHIEAAMNRIVKKICEAARCRGHLDYTRVLPATVNDAALTDLTVSVAEKVLGAGRVKESELVMGSEDFCYYGRKVPASFAFLGVGTDASFPHHSAKFDLDESVLYLGTALHAAFAWEYLA